MAQFDIHRYRRAGSRARFVVDLQNGLLEPIATRVVAPLYPLHPGQNLLKGLNPEIEVPGDDGVFISLDSGISRFRSLPRFSVRCSVNAWAASKPDVRTSSPRSTSCSPGSDDGR